MHNNSDGTGNSASLQACCWSTFLHGLNSCMWRFDDVAASDLLDIRSTET